MREWAYLRALFIPVLVCFLSCTNSPIEKSGIIKGVSIPREIAKNACAYTISADGKYIVYSDRNNNNLFFYDSKISGQEKEKYIRIAQGRHRICSLAASPDTGRILAGDEAGVVSLWSPADAGAGPIKAWDASSGEKVDYATPRNIFNPVVSVAFGDDGDNFFSILYPCNKTIAPEGTLYIISMGIGRFRHHNAFFPDIPSAREDASAIIDTFKTQENHTFKDVVVLFSGTDLTHDMFFDGIRTLNKIKNVKAGDTILFYISSHMKLQGDKFHIAVHDTKFNGEDIQDKSILISHLINDISSEGKQAKYYFIFDGCQSSPDASYFSDLKNLALSPSFAIAAAGIDQSAVGFPRGLSCFTGGLTKLLDPSTLMNRKDYRITLRELKNELAATIPKYNKECGEQRPEIFSIKQNENYLDTVIAAYDCAKAEKDVCCR